jgi:hypothetical protein
VSQHKYRVGQSVHYTPARPGVAPSGDYKIVRLLPAEGFDLLYRIKSRGESYERVAKERELTRPQSE